MAPGPGLVKLIKEKSFILVLDSLQFIVKIKELNNTNSLPYTIVLMYFVVKRIRHSMDWSNQITCPCTCRERFCTHNRCISHPWNNHKIVHRGSESWSKPSVWNNLFGLKDYKRHRDKTCNKLDDPACLAQWDRFHTNPISHLFVQVHSNRKVLNFRLHY